MLKIRRSNQRGQADHGWLQSSHSFSFAEYYDPNNMGYRSLRVINEDFIEGGRGFGMHPHSDMEIITYVVEGSLEHKDSMSNSAIIYPEEVQRMTAGTGVWHSEYNHVPDKTTHLFQIWIMPQQRGGQPGYAQKSFAKELASQEKVLVVSQDGRQGSLSIKQDADLYVSRIKKGQTAHHELRKGRGLWVQMVKGVVSVQADKEAARLNTGDGLVVEDAMSITLKADEDSEILLFDLT